ncbi:hypothetical protein VPH35_011978 [Triticum aestivum]
MATGSCSGNDAGTDGLGSCNRHMTMLEPVSPDVGPHASWTGDTFFAGTSLYFCWNRLSFFATMGTSLFFCLRLFCWNQHYFLLELANSFATIGLSLFAAEIFAGTTIKFCWNRQIYLLQPSTRGFCCIRFLLEIASSFAGTS